MFVYCYNSSVINLFNLKRLVLFPAQIYQYYIGSSYWIYIHADTKLCQDLHDGQHLQDRLHPQGHRLLVHHLQVCIIYNCFITL